MQQILIQLFLVLLLTQINGQLTIYSPQKVKDFFKDGLVDYSIGNFGHIPYGRSLIGSIQVADPINACSPLNARNPELHMDTPFILARRGNCTFVTKATYAQQAGAKMVILIDNIQKEETDDVIMSDDGHAYQLDIPAIIINSLSGDKILQYLNQDSALTYSEQTGVQLTIKFDTNHQNAVNYTFWLKPNDRFSNKLVRDFSEIRSQLELVPNTKFSAHYQFYSDQNCRRNNWICDVPNECVSGGRYCAYDPDGDGQATGRDVILETLRQICLYSINPNVWWNYIPAFDIGCINMAGLQDCSYQLITTLREDPQKIKNCVQQSFIKKGNELYTDVDIVKDDNRLLQNEKLQYISNGVYFWPSITVNQIQYRGNLVAQEILEDICSNYKDQPQLCLDLLNNDDSSVIQNKDGYSGSTIFWVTFLIFVFFSIMLMVYRRMVKREVQREMSQQVNSMVSSYIAFYETKEKNERENRL